MKKFNAKVVIFDYGNTLVLDPFEYILDRKIVRFVSSLLKKSESKVRKAFTQANKEINYPHITHFALEEPIVWQALRKLEVESNKIIFLSPKIVEAYRKEYKNLLKSYERKNEIKDVLEYLRNKGKRLGIISNGREVDLNSALEWLGIRKYFDFTITSEEVGIEKPKKKIFLYLLKKFEETPEKTIYIGDDPLKDVETPKKLGMKMILFVPPKKYQKPLPWRRYDIKPKVKPDLRIKKLAELKKFF